MIKNFLRSHLRAITVVALFGSLTASAHFGNVSAMSGGQSQAPASKASQNPFAGDQAALVEGADLFGRNCQQCHSTRGIGGKCPQLIHGAWGPEGANSDELMFRTISEGRPNTQMGAFKDALTKDEIWKIVAYLRYEAQRYAHQKKNDDEDSDRR